MANNLGVHSPRFDTTPLEGGEQFMRQQLAADVVRLQSRARELGLMQMVSAFNEVVRVVGAECSKSQS